MKSSGIGGQAVLEGVMMKNKQQYAVAVRKPDNEIEISVNNYVSLGERHKVLAWPIIRGVVAFCESLYIGTKTLTWSASFYEEDEKAGASKNTGNNTKNTGSNGNKKDSNGNGKSSNGNEKKNSVKENIAMGGTVVLSVLLAVGIFMLLPYFLSNLLNKVITATWALTLIEGVIRLVLFIGYVLVISCMRDIKRVFMYHGAEHKSINCVESGLPLTVENVRKQSKEHKRCGTSFLLTVMLISIVFFMFIRVDSAWLRVVLRIALIPVIAGVSYEFIKLAGRSENVVVAILSKPGLLLQGLTTREPEDSMIECAIASVEAVFDWKKYQEELEAEKAQVQEKREAAARKSGGRLISAEAKKETSETEKEAVKAEEVKTEEVKAEEVKAEVVKTEEAKAEEVKPAVNQNRSGKGKNKNKNKTKASAPQNTFVAPESRTEETKAEEVKPEAVKDEAAKAENEKAEPAKTEPAKTEPAKTEAAKEEVKTEPVTDGEDKHEDKNEEKNKEVKAEPVKTEPVKVQKKSETKDDDLSKLDVFLNAPKTSDYVYNETRKDTAKPVNEIRSAYSLPSDEEEEDDEILKALDTYFVGRKD